jgi:hypothetical protein
MESGQLAEDEAVEMEDAVREPALLKVRPLPYVPAVIPKPLKTIKPIPRLAGDLTALGAPLVKGKPMQTLLQTARLYTILYGFADAPAGSGFGSTVLGKDGIRYHIGTWDSYTQESSSNFRELKNVVEALKEEAQRGHPRNALIFLCTNNSIVEAALVSKGNSSSEKLFKLVLEVRCLEIHKGAKIGVSHISVENG